MPTRLSCRLASATFRSVEHVDLDPTLVEIRPLREADDLSAFACGDTDLDEFLRNDAARLQALNIVRVYTSFTDGALVGYVAILNDTVVLKTPDKKKLALNHDDHPAIPAVKIARLAVDASFRQRVSGMGKHLVRFAFHLARAQADQIGCRLLTVDAYKASVGFYENLGFVRNKVKASDGEKLAVDEDTISMRLDLAETPSWADEKSD